MLWRPDPTNLKPRSSQADDQITEAAQRAIDELHKVCTCGGVAAIAMVVAAYAESIAAAMNEEGLIATVEEFANAIYTRSVRIICRIPAPPNH